MSDIRLWDVRGALVSIFTAAFATATIDAVVFDGPRSRPNGVKQWLLVGSEGGEDGGGDALQDEAVATQQWSELGGNRWRLESGSVLCGAWAWNGTVKTSVARAQVQQMTEVCAEAIAADPTLGGLLTKGGSDFGAELTGLRVREAQGQRGEIARGAFTVSYRTLIVP